MTRLIRTTIERKLTAKKNRAFRFRFFETGLAI